MIISLEGADFSGKTTLTKYLNKKYKIPIFPEPNTREYFNNDEKWLDHINHHGYIAYHYFKYWPKDKNIFINRSWLSTMVYSNIFNRKDDLSYIRVNDWIDKMVIIIIQVSPGIVEARIKSKVRKDECKKILKNIWKIYDEYDFLYRTSFNMMPNIYYVTDDISVEEILKMRKII
jgi:thymidylate kinase